MSTELRSAITSSLSYLPVRQDWLEQYREPILEPDLYCASPRDARRHRSD